MYLYFDVKDTTLARFDDRGDGLLASAIEIAREFCVFNETAPIEERNEVFTRDKMVLDAINFSWPWRTRCVWKELRQDAWRKRKGTNGIR